MCGFVPFIQTSLFIFLFLCYPYFSTFPFHLVLFHGTTCFFFPFLCVILYFFFFFLSVDLSYFKLFKNPFPPLLPSSCSFPWWLLLGTVAWHHLYCVFTYIYSILIEKDPYECQIVSVKFPCMCIGICSIDLEASSIFGKFPLFIPVSDFN